MIDRSREEVTPIPKAPKPARDPYGGLPRMRATPRNRKGVSDVVKTSLTKRAVDEACRDYRRRHPKCELAGVAIVCGSAGSPSEAATETHHRRARSAGGFEVDERNLLAVCEAHHEWIEGAGREMAKACGWLVEREDPGYFDLGPDDRRDQ